MRHTEKQNTTIPEHHAQKFYKTIQEFLDYEPSTHIEVQHELLNSILENENLSQQQIAQLVFYSTMQTAFLSKLKTQWENFVQFNNIKIEKA